VSLCLFEKYIFINHIMVNYFVDVLFQTYLLIHVWIGLHILPQDLKTKVQLCVLWKTGPDIMDDSTPLLVPPTKR
ncbi:TPA: hypothetical protein ACGGQA_003492, partial [Escherichia coli]